MVQYADSVGMGWIGFSGWGEEQSTVLIKLFQFHYVFNLRDLSRIWLGMIGTKADVISSIGATIHLWRHEVSRVIADRFVNQADKDWFDNEVISTVRAGLGEESKTLAADVKYFGK